MDRTGSRWFSRAPDRGTPALVLFALLSLFILFNDLGGAALSEPDEGRNAEIAREILLVNDWITPHYDFTPRLDKPIFFYVLTALSYKLFGISEWTARLPSALSGLGGVLLTYLFARALLGPWAALWSGLILVTCAEYAAFGRLVMLDMSLNLFVVLALFSFYWATLADGKRKKRAYYLLMYASMGCATLIKGPFGFVVPGMIIFAYILIQRRWSILAEMEWIWGALVFVLIVAPWYAWAEMRNPGYLRYFLADEHFLRFFTPHFRRTKPWYFFPALLAGGFFPWTLLLPGLIRRLWKRSLDDLSLYLILWTLLPPIFFSLSSSKMPEYILPVFPALSILAGRTIVELLAGASQRSGTLSLPWQTLNLLLLYFVAGIVWPGLLPEILREPILQVPQMPVAFTVILLLAFVLLPLTAWIAFFRQRRLFVAGCMAFGLVFLASQRAFELVATTRSSKELANRAAPFLRPADQIVIYDTFLAGLPFYLRVEKPIWMVWPGKKSNVMGSVYVAQKTPQPAPGYGQALFTFEEFSKQWNESDRRLLVFIKEKNLSQLDRPRELLQVGQIVLATNR